MRVYRTCSVFFSFRKKTAGENSMRVIELFCIFLLREKILFAIWRERSACVFITAVPITKLFARGWGGMEDMCYERLRAEAGVN
jgi:hypothetical protein